MSIKEKARSYYNSVSRTYDGYYLDTVSIFEDKVTRNYIQRFLSENALVLDAGCGTGNISLEFSNYVENVIGFDLSKNMIIQLNHKKPLSNYLVSMADLENIPFKDNTFDLVISLYGPLSYCPDFNKACYEITRVLKRGGYLVASVYDRLALQWITTAICNLDLTYFVKGKFSTINCVGDISFAHFFTKPELKSRLESNGLKVIDYRGLSIFGHFKPLTSLIGIEQHFVDQPFFTKAPGNYILFSAKKLR
jgi:ubiquinone/menaquinone biosynthesis C-methylase UbiE